MRKYNIITVHYVQYCYSKYNFCYHHISSLIKFDIFSKDLYERILKEYTDYSNTFLFIPKLIENTI